ncbi:MAG: MBL fold metallo-hydrolase [Armatimonadota bacterium]|nr:MBL fold metallo-hydrolase [Armatimonadota bacterium]
MTLEDEFGDIIKKARRGLGQSADEVYRATRIEPGTLAEMESYRYAPNDDQIRALAGVLELDAAKLTEIARGAWSPKPEPWLTQTAADVTLVPVDVGGYVENCYIIACPLERRALIVDPGGAVDIIAETISDSGFRADAIAITHGHSDHTAGVPGLVEALGVPTIIGHSEAVRSLGGAGVRLRHVQDEDEFAVGQLNFKVLHTPGHTTASCCYLTGSICCVGDTLFAGSVGGTQGPTAYQSLLKSIRSKLLSLPAATVPLPGHGPATTVGEQLKHNPFF